MTPAWLHLRGITFDTILGCHPSERTTPRPIVVDLSVQLDITKAAHSNALSDTLNTETLETLGGKLTARRVKGYDLPFGVARSATEHHLTRNSRRNVRWNRVHMGAENHTRITP